MQQEKEKDAQRPSADFAGACGGLIFFCLSLTPSLLPRGYVVQGIASGLSVATGYGFGVLGSKLYKMLPLHGRGKLPAAAKRIAVSALIAAAVVFLFAGLHWQQQVRSFTDTAPASGWYLPVTLIVAMIVATLLILAGRGVRRLSRRFAHMLRRLPPRIARYGGALLTAITLTFLVNGVLLRAVFGFVNYSFGLGNKGTPDGIYQPQNSAFSGSPASKIDWNSLGEKGREFVASAPSQKAIASFTGDSASTQPSRLYAGLESAPTLGERVGLLTAELNRTHAYDKKAVLIAIPTGSGGINAKAVQSVEYIYGGSVASLGIQYSYLPSWLSFVADQDAARENGRVLTDAVYTWWSHLNPAARPRLLMYGESLGTLGADGAFSGAADMQNRMQGILLAGPPNSNQLWTNLVNERDSGAREVLPTYQKGEVVRFSDGVTSFEKNPANQPWAANKVAILQHGSDPVVWASLRLFVQKPDWLREPRAYDVPPNMRWYPLVTGFQVGLDLPFAFSATPGHGHRYDNSIASGWLAITQTGLGPEKTAELTRIINAVP